MKNKRKSSGTFYHNCKIGDLLFYPTRPTKHEKTFLFIIYVVKSKYKIAILNKKMKLANQRQYCLELVEIFPGTNGRTIESFWDIRPYNLYSHEEYKLSFR